MNVTSNSLGVNTPSNVSCVNGTASALLSPEHAREWIEGSGVSETITRLNVRTIDDAREADKALNRKTKSRWQHSDQLVPGWLVTGVDPKTGERIGLGCQFKPDKLQPKLDKEFKPIPDKFDKYLSASDTEAEPLFLDPGIEGYWQQVLEDSQCPIVITEGAKKAGTILTQGIAAISIPGVWNGQKQDRLKPNLEQFCGIGRTVYLAFDSDSTQKAGVRAALDNLGRLIAQCGAVVYLLTWEPNEGKGIDDYLVNGGNLQGLLENSKTFKEWRALSAQNGNPGSQNGDTEKRNVADQLIDLSTSPNVTLWHTPEGDAFADILEVGIRQTLPIRSKSFRQWLNYRHYQKNKRSPSNDVIQQAISTLEAKAVFEGQEHPVNLRVAEQNGRLYLDLGTPDWKVVEVSPDGWRLITDSPVRFRRASQQPLPIPESGGNLDQLQQLVGIDGDSWLLFLAYLLNCLKPQGSYPILILHGEARAGKSTKSRVIRKLIDPGEGDLLTPRILTDPRTLAIAATRRHLLAFDNLSGVNAEQSDDLCRLATGGSFTQRVLNTDSEEMTFSFVKPVILNGIDSIATRGDLLDRSILLPIKRPSKRREEEEFWREFDEIYAKTIGALLDLLSKVLAVLPTVELPEDCPRMMGYARIGIATERVLGLEPGAFINAYQGVMNDANETAIEASPVAQAIINLMEHRTDWKGSSTELLNELNSRVDENTRKSKDWAKTASALGKKIPRLQTILRPVGIEIDNNSRSNSKRYISISVMKDLPSLPSLPSHPNQGEALNGDGNSDGKKDGCFAVTGNGDSKTDAGDGKSFLVSSLEPLPNKGCDSGDSSDGKKRPYSGNGRVEFKQNDRVRYVGSHPTLKQHYPGVLTVRTIHPDGVTCLTEANTTTTRLPKADLQLDGGES